MRNQRSGRSTAVTIRAKPLEIRMSDTLLNNLGEWRPAGTGPHSFGHTLATGWTVSATVDAADTVGCRLTELAVTRPAKAATAAELTQWAVHTAGRVTGLLEPLKLIEVD